MTTRSLMILVALVAVALGAIAAIANDLRYRRPRDRAAMMERTHLKFAANSEELRLYCERHRGTPYPAKDRPIGTDEHPRFFSSWEQEAAFHADNAKRFRETAASLGTLRRRYTRKLLWP